MPFAWFAALLALHSSWHALTVFCWARTGAERNDAPNMNAPISATLRITASEALLMIAGADRLNPSVALLAFRDVAGFCGAREWLAILAESAVFAAFLQETCFGGARERLSILPDCLHGAGLGVSGAHCKSGDQCSQGQTSHSNLLVSNSGLQMRAHSCLWLNC